MRNLPPLAAPVETAPPLAVFYLLPHVQAVVRSLPGEPNMIITLTVGGKQRNMDRCERGGTCLLRQPA